MLYAVMLSICLSVYRSVEVGRYRYDIGISDPKNRGYIDILTAAFFGLLMYFIIASKVVSDVSVIP